MGKTVKASLWVLGLFSALGLGAYCASCGDDNAHCTPGEGDACTCVCRFDGIMVCSDGTMRSDCRYVECSMVGDLCTGGFCAEMADGSLECSAECTTIGDDCNNFYDDGAHYCYAADYGNVCLTTGEKEAGATCNSVNACISGYPCLSNVCYQLCDTDEDCTTEGETCQGIEGATFNVCAIRLRVRL